MLNAREKLGNISSSCNLGSGNDYYLDACKSPNNIYVASKSPGDETKSQFIRSSGELTGTRDGQWVRTIKFL